MTDNDELQQRRRALHLIGATALVPVLGACAASSHAAESIDLSTPEARLKTFVRMRGALDDRLVIGYITGRYYGVVDGDPTPLFGVAAATFSRYRALQGGGYEIATHEQAFFTDLTSGKRLEEWTNPLNGKRVKPAVVQSQPSWRIVRTDLTFRGREPDAPGVQFDQRVLAPEVLANDVVFTEQARYVGQFPGTPRPFRYAEVVSFRAPVAALQSSDSAAIPTSTGYTSVSSWRPWMEMGDAPGELVGTGSGGNGVRIDQLPSAWRDAARVARPALLEDPGAPIAAIWNR